MYSPILILHKIVKLSEMNLQITSIRMDEYISKIVMNEIKKIVITRYFDFDFFKVIFMIFNFGLNIFCD